MSADEHRARPPFHQSDPARTDHAVVIPSAYWLLIGSLGTVGTTTTEGQLCILNSEKLIEQK